MINCSEYKRLHLNYVNSFKNNTESKYHRECLNELRKYLDNIGYKMPKPKWEYNQYDISTHPYVSGRVVKNKLGFMRHIPYLNPEFKYPHLLNDTRIKKC